MRKFFSVLFIPVLFSLHISAQLSKHVILISIDGFRPDMYLDKSWPTPNLQRLMKEGAYADHLLSVFPAYTYPSHAAMITGALPARSGICFNQPRGSQGEWNWEAKYLKAPTIFEALQRKGMTSATVMWPGTAGATYINYNISEIWDVDNPEDRITATRRLATPGIIEDIETNATGKLAPEDMDERYLSLDGNTGRMAAYVFEKYKPSLLAIHFACVDGAEHEYGREHDSIRLAVATNDRAIGEVMEAVTKSGLKDSTTIIIIGDHGFSDIHEVFRPNRLIRDLPARFIAAGGSAFLYLTAGSEGTPKEQIIDSVKARLNTLPKDLRKKFRFVERQELDKYGADSSAILALAAVPGTVFSGAIDVKSQKSAGPGTVIKQNHLDGFVGEASGGHHGYDPQLPVMHTGFIAYGAGIHKGKVKNEIGVKDISPLIAKLLGITFNCADGVLVEGVAGK